MDYVIDCTTGDEGLVDGLARCECGANFIGACEARSRIALRIEIDEQDAATELRECEREVNRGSGLADAAFLICDCDYPPHINTHNRARYWHRFT